MFRLIAGGFRIIGLALLGLVGALIAWPWQTALVLVLLTAFVAFLVHHHRRTTAARVLAMDIWSMSPAEYEEYCCALLRAAGWNARVIGKQGDQGVDVLAALEHAGVGVALQCKLWRGKVGNSAVQQVASGRRFWGAHVGVVIAPLGYTASAKKAADANGILLLSHSDLPKLEKLIGVPV